MGVEGLQHVTRKKRVVDARVLILLEVGQLVLSHVNHDGDLLPYEAEGEMEGERLRLGGDVFELGRVKSRTERHPTCNKASPIHFRRAHQKFLKDATPRLQRHFTRNHQHPIGSLREKGEKASFDKHLFTSIDSRY